MRVLAIASAYGGCTAAVLDGDTVVAEGRIAEEMGLAAALPVLVAALLDRARLHPASPALDLVAAAVGPGSFTGLRAGLSVAAGIGLALGIPVVGATAAEAFAAGAFGLDGRALWTAIEARRGRVFIDMGAGFVGGAPGFAGYAPSFAGCANPGSAHAPPGFADVANPGFAGYATTALPAARGRVAVCGNAANLVAATLAARGADVMLTSWRTLRPQDVAAAALRRHAGALPPLAAEPLYIDAPQVSPPAGGLRVAPAPAPA